MQAWLKAQKEILCGQFEELAINTAKFALKIEFSEPWHRRNLNEVDDITIL